MLPPVPSPLNPTSSPATCVWRELMEAFAALNAIVMAEGQLNGELKQMIAAVVSTDQWTSRVGAGTREAHRRARAAV